MNRLGNLPELGDLSEQFKSDSTIQNENQAFKKKQSRQRTLDVRGLGTGETLAKDNVYTKEYGIGDAAYDVGSTIVSGAEQVTKALDGLGDMVTGGAVSRFNQSYEKELDKLYKSTGTSSKEILDKYHDKLFTDRAKAERKNIASASSFTDAIKKVASNPIGSGTYLGESLVSSVAGGALGSFAKTAGIVKTGVAAGAVGEGLIGAGLSFDNMSSKREDRKAQVSDYLASLGIGVGTGLIGAAGGTLAKRYGFTDVDVALAGGNIGKSSGNAVKSTFANMAKGAGSEGLEEAAQSALETVLTNASLGEPLTKGLGASVGTGAALGMGSGVLFNSVTPLLKSDDKGEALDPSTGEPYTDKRVSKVANKVNQLINKKLELSKEGLDTSEIDAHIDRLVEGLQNTKPENKPEVGQEIDTLSSYATSLKDTVNSVSNLVDTINTEEQIKSLVKDENPNFTDDEAAIIANNIHNKVLYNAQNKDTNIEDVYKIAFNEELSKASDSDYFKSKDDIDTSIDEVEESKVEIIKESVNKIVPKDAFKDIPDEVIKASTEPSEDVKDVKVNDGTTEAFKAPTEPSEDVIDTINSVKDQLKDVAKEFDSVENIEEAITETDNDGLTAPNNNDNKPKSVSELTNEELINEAGNGSSSFTKLDLQKEAIKRIKKGEITFKDLEENNKVVKPNPKPISKIKEKASETIAKEIEDDSKEISDVPEIIERTADIIESEISKLQEKIDDLDVTNPSHDRLISKYSNQIIRLKRELSGVSEELKPDVPNDLNDIIAEDNFDEIEQASIEDISDDILLKDDTIDMSILSERSAKRLNDKTITNNLTRAKQILINLHIEGKTFLEINAEMYRKTGWYFDKNDSQFKFLISDKDIEVKHVDGIPVYDTIPENKPVLLSSIIHHEKLFKAYPALKSLKVIKDSSLPVYGRFDPKGFKTLQLKHTEITDGRSELDALPVLLHEITHYIQLAEGFNQGGSKRFTQEQVVKFLESSVDKLNNEINILSNLPTSEIVLEKLRNATTFLKLNAKRLKDIRNGDLKALNIIRRDMYYNIYGEIEARAVADRISLSQEELLKQFVPGATIPDSVKVDSITQRSASNYLNFSIAGDVESFIQEVSSNTKVKNKTILIKHRIKKNKLPKDVSNAILEAVKKIDPDSKGNYSWQELSLELGIAPHSKASHEDMVNAINHIKDRLNYKNLTTTISGVEVPLEIVAVNKYKDISDKKVRKILKKNRAKGAVDRKSNTIYLITSVHSSTKDIVQTFAHELIGHLGVKKVLGSKVDNFYARMLRSDKTLLKDIMQLVPKYRIYLDQWNSKNDISKLDSKEIISVKVGKEILKIPFEVGIRLADEYIAKIAAQEVFYTSFIKDEVGFTKKQRVIKSKKRLKFLKNVVSKIAHFFRTRSGKQAKNLTHDDIKKALAASVNHVFKSTNFDYTRLISEEDYLKLAQETKEGITDTGELKAFEAQVRADFVARKAIKDMEESTEEMSEMIKLMMSSDWYQINKSSYNKRLDKIGGIIRRTKVLSPFFATGSLNHAKYLSIIESKSSGLYSNIQNFSRKFKKLSSNMSDKATHEVYLYFTDSDAEVPDIQLHPNPKLDSELRSMLPEAKRMISELGNKLVGLGVLNAETYLENKDKYLPTMYVKYLSSYHGSKLKPSFRDYLKEKNKDMTDLDRELQGQIKDPSYLVYTALNQISRDVALNQMYDAIYKASDKNNLKWVLGDSDIIEDKFGNKMTPMALRSKIEYLEDLIRIHETANTKRAVNFSEITYLKLKDELNEFKLLNEAYNDSIINDVKRLVRDTENRDLTDDDVKAFLNQNYIKMPSGKRYGNLADQYVRKEIYNSFFEIDQVMLEMNQGDGSKITNKKLLQSTHAFFKHVKVGLNPTSHVRNAMSNFIHLDMGTTTNTASLFKSVISTLDSIIKNKNDRFIDYAYKSGLSTTTFSAHEMFQVTNAYAKFLKAAEEKSMWGKIFPYLTAQFSSLTEVTSHAFGMNEMLFKTVALRDQIEIWERENLPKGKTIENAGLDPIQKEAVIAEAAAHANKVLLDYSKVNPFVANARRYYLGAPFLTYVYKTFPVMVENIAKRPFVFAKYAALPYIMQQLLMSAFDWDDDDFERYMNSLGERARDSSTFMLLPFKDDKGNVQAVEFDYVFPMAQYFNLFNKVRGGVSYDSTTEFISSSSSVIKDGLTDTFGFLGGPVPQTINLLMANKNSFTDRPVWTEGATAAQNIQEVTSYMASMFIPPWATEYGVINKTFKAFGHYKKYDLSDDQYELGQVASSFLGVNIKDTNPNQSIQFEAIKFAKEERNISKARMKALKEAKRKGLSQQEITSIIKEYSIEIKRLRQKKKDFFSNSVIGK